VLVIVPYSLWIWYNIHDPRRRHDIYRPITSHQSVRSTPPCARFRHPQSRLTTIRLFLVQTMMIHLLIVLLLSFFHYGGAQQTLYPPAIPLAVRSSTFSSWQFTPSGSTVGSLWPTTASHQPNASQDPSLNVCRFPFVRCSSPTHSVFRASTQSSSSVWILSPTCFWDMQTQ
jgi:hypothetical protein